jgi:hypothetical protein
LGTFAAFWVLSPASELLILGRSRQWHDPAAPTSLDSTTRAVNAAFSPRHTDV